jgi:hypothetical protein
MDRRTDGQTDAVSYRGATSRLKKLSVWSRGKCSTCFCFFRLLKPTLFYSHIHDYVNTLYVSLATLWFKKTQFIVICIIFTYTRGSRVFSSTFLSAATRSRSVGNGLWFYWGGKSRMWWVSSTTLFVRYDREVATDYSFTCLLQFMSVCSLLLLGRTKIGISQPCTIRLDWNFLETSGWYPRLACMFWFQDLFIL